MYPKDGLSSGYVGAQGQHVVVALSAQTLAAVQRYGPTVNGIAKEYGLTGDALLAKLVMGESGDRGDAVSSAGARAWTQFTAGSRKVAMDKYGIDPWADVDQAVHAASLHLRGKINGSTGLKGYNPGDPSYTNYILGQKVGNVAGGASRSSAPGTTTRAAPSSSGSASAAAPQALLGAPDQADFTSLLGSLLSGGQPQQQAPAPMQVAPPSFSAHAPTPQGFNPAQTSSAPEPQQQDGLSAALSLVGTLGTSTAGVGQPQASGTGIADQVINGPKGIAETVMADHAASKKAGISPNARPGDPVVSRQQSVGGLHETAGLAGYPAHDFMAPAGTHAVAPVSGKVVRLSGHDPANGPTNGPHGPFGYSLYIQGTDGKTYYLTHMGSRDVKAGQTVKQGQIIGTVGDYAKWGGADHIHMGVSG